jgi:putative phosphoribosyl transferase
MAINTRMKSTLDEPGDPEPGSPGKIAEPNLVDPPVVAEKAETLVVEPSWMSGQPRGLTTSVKGFRGPAGEPVSIFRNRIDAGYRLFERLRGRELHNPVVLAIPCGGLVTGAVLALELGAELDVFLARKLRARENPELAVGAVAEYGSVYLRQHAHEVFDVSEIYVAEERDHQLGEIACRKEVYRAVRPAAAIKGRSVIVADDGIFTGSTMIAALEAIRLLEPFELIVAVPVAPPASLEEIRRRCDELVCLMAPKEFLSIGQFYADFPPVSEAEAVELLKAGISSVASTRRT